LPLLQVESERQEVERTVREAYRLRSRQEISPFSPREMGSVATFLRHAYFVISIAPGNLDRFRTVTEFVSSSIDG
jgi:hypothetical protein